MKRSCLITIIGVILVLVLVQLDAAQTNYCRICRNHVGCRPRRGFGRKCGSKRSAIVITENTKKTLLQAHNGLRSIVASGSLKGYKPAERMAYMQWSDELAKLALINARKCNLHYDKCRKTKRFPWAGQNVGMDIDSETYPNVTQSFYRTIFNWFNEYQNADSNIIEAYRVPARNRRRYNNFTVLIHDRQTHVGCAAVRFKDRKRYKIYWVCNYSMRNVANRAVYVAGTPYNGCKTGPNEGFPALCSPNEPIVNVPHKVNTNITAVDGKSNAVNLNKASRQKGRRSKRTRGRGSRPNTSKRRNMNADYS